MIKNNMFYGDPTIKERNQGDRVPDHIDAMFQERYGYHFNRD